MSMVCSLDNMTNFIAEAERRYQVLGKFKYATEDTTGTQRPISPVMEKAWQHAVEVLAQGQAITCIVTGWNRGGLLVRWEELQGFVPASQMNDVTLFECDEPLAETLATWIGEELTLKIIELDKERNRLVFSQRATAWGPHDGELLLSEITPGEIRNGRVSNLCEFGAFIDLGGLDGLVHLSELSWRRINHPRELLHIGQVIRVFVIDVDRNNHRVALSLKRLRPNPWTVVESRYTVGQEVSAVVTNVVDFGAFAQIEDGLEGLVHVSEFVNQDFRHPSEVVSVGDAINVRIMRIDSKNNRLGLSMRLDQGI